LQEISRIHSRAPSPRADLQCATVGEEEERRKARPPWLFRLHAGSRSMEVGMRECSPGRASHAAAQRTQGIGMHAGIPWRPWSGHHSTNLSFRASQLCNSAGTVQVAGDATRCRRRGLRGKGRWRQGACPSQTKQGSWSCGLMSWDHRTMTVARSALWLA